MRKQRRVWAIYYKIRLNASDSWRRHEWVGPCGIFLGYDIPLFIENCLSGRPLFFKTRALARQQAKVLHRKENVSWHWVKYKVEPFILSWEKSK